MEPINARLSAVAGLRRGISALNSGIPCGEEAKQIVDSRAGKGEAMGIRKNQAKLSQPEGDAFVAAVKKLKGIKGKEGYDRFVEDHRKAFEEQPSPAHFGPGFLPWHREFLLRFEIALQRIDPTVSLPYWDWTVDNSKSSSLWGSSFMGGDGSPNERDRVTTGPFASNNGWLLTILPSDETDPFLKRALGRDSQLPTSTDVNKALRYLPYDLEPWDGSPEDPNYPGFRKGMEFSIHGPAHVWVGGSMNGSCAPNDPVFWLHHCNVDRLWAQWQSSTPGWPYLPPTGSTPLPGHCLDDPMPPWDSGTFSPTPHSVLNHRALGYQYDGEPNTPEVYAAVSWEMGSYWRVYGCASGSVYEKRCDNGTVGTWNSIALGRAVSAITWRGSNRTNPPIRIYVGQAITGGDALQEYSWDGRIWVNSWTWPWPPTRSSIASIAAVSWQIGSHIRVYASDGINVWEFRQDGRGWIGGNFFAGNLLSAISWEDNNGVHIRMHVRNANGKISVWTSSDGQNYQEGQLP
jgi:Common central domain of tyrosinase